MSDLFLERTVEEETIIIESKQKSPCLSCKHSGKKHDEYCYSRCVDKPNFPGYEPHNQTYDYRKRQADQKLYEKVVKMKAEKLNS